ncbi:hypothetical protein WMY93_028769 [Mugilogobius chulae]|uniref:Transmembrane protein 160 n=1 Tax=Mugilogobius chulae TaxID=88201 RepID=A0AAW0MSQ7_9GOBI
MALLRLFLRRQLPQAVSHFVRAVRFRKLHGTAPLRQDKGPWPRGRSTDLLQQHQQHQHYQQLTDLDKADALMLRKSHETGFLSWFRNGLLATGIGVIAFVQSEVGREAGYAFFILGGVCVSFGGASYIGSLFALRRMMLLSVPALLLQGAVVSSVALFWLCAVSLYIGRLEVEIIHEDDEEECRECRERREQRGYGDDPSLETNDSDSKRSDK